MSQTLTLVRPVAASEDKYRYKYFIAIAVTLAAVLDRYVFSHLPLSVNAASRHSNGTATTFGGMQNAISQRHISSSSVTLRK